MLTPHFEVSQDADFVEVRIRVPHLRMEEGEFYVQENEFKFHLRPYFLRLTFKQRLTEDGRETATHDIVTSVLTIRIPKARSGEHFEDLGMLSELLRKPESTVARSGALIEVLSSTEAAGAEDNEEMPDDTAIEADAEQALPTVDSLCGHVRYGFNDAYSGVFVGLESDEVVHLRHPERTAAHERRAARLAAEDAAFDAEHYMADLMDDGPVQAALSYTPWWTSAAAAAAAGLPAAAAARAAAAPPRLSATTDPAQGPALSGDCGVGRDGRGGGGGGGGAADEGGWLPMASAEQQQLLALPRKEFLLSPVAARRAAYGLIDLLFSYCYDTRTTEGEPTVESGWTVRSISSQLSFLDAHESAAEAARACVRRSLCLPLLRHWKLALAVLSDTLALLLLGRGAVLLALLQTRQLLQKLDDGYLLNRVWLDDYCVWVQSISPHQLVALADELRGVHLRKEAVGLLLVENEELARTEEREQEMDEKQEETLV